MTYSRFSKVINVLGEDFMTDYGPPRKDNHVIPAVLHWGNKRLVLDDNLPGNVSRAIPCPMIHATADQWAGFVQAAWQHFT